MEYFLGFTKTLNYAMLCHDFPNRAECFGFVGNNSFAHMAAASLASSLSHNL